MKKFIVLVSTGLLAVGAYGTQQTINVGTTNNDGTGDPLRVAFQKANSNFTEIYGSTNVYLVPADTRQVTLTNPANQFGGNGTLLTNLSTKSLHKDFGVTGIGDETAKYQVAANTPGVTTIDITGTASNIVFTNGVTWRGDGISTIYQNTNANGALLTVGQNTTNVVLDTVIWNGSKMGFNGLSYSKCWAEDAGGNISQNVSVQRDGLHIGNFNTNCIIRHCVARSFSSAGYYVDGYNVEFPVPTNATTTFDNDVAQDCWQGFRTTNSAEYVIFNNCHAMECGEGFALISGNDSVGMGEAVACGIGVYVGGYDTDPNPAHGKCVGLNLNHNASAVTAHNFNNGFKFIGCDMLANGYICLTNVAAVEFIACPIGSTATITIDGSAHGGTAYAGMNTFRVCSVAGYPVITSINGGLWATDGFLNAGSLAPMTNGFSNVFTVPLTTYGVILPTNSAFPMTPIVSNGVSAYWNSNGSTYLRSSRDGATNWADTLIASPP